MPFIQTTEAALTDAQGFNLARMRPLRPVYIGSRAGLHRYAVAAEKAEIDVGAYNPDADATYTWPGREEDESTIDLSYVKLFVDAADLLYYTKSVGIGGSLVALSTYRNRVRHATTVYKTGNGYDHDTTFIDRGVVIGDIAYVRGVVDSTTYELWTSVTGFVAEPVAADVDDAYPDDNNRADQDASVSITQVEDTPVNDVVATANGAAYESSADGYISRTYTVTVTQSSVGGDATTARLRVRSADGLDDVDDVTPSAFGDPTAIGTKGLLVTWTIDPAHSSASTYGVDEDDFVVGQAWTIAVAQAWTAPEATSGGTYAGETDTTYIVRVERGGHVDDAAPPRIAVTTTTGIDNSGPTVVEAAATEVSIGSYGVTIEFDQARLRKGDIYYVPVTAVGEGAIQTLILKDELPEEIAGLEIDLKLYIRQTGVQIATARALPATATNWSADADGVTVESGIHLTDPTYTDDGVLVGLPLKRGTLYIEYREWLTAGSGSVIDIAVRSAVSGLLGTVHPDNPVAFAADRGLRNTAGDVLSNPSSQAAANTDVVRCVVLDGDPSDPDVWAAGLEMIEELTGAYGLVPLTTDSAVFDLVTAHVADQSTDEKGLHRVCWLRASITETGAVVSADTADDDATVLMTISQLPASSPARYTLVQITSGNASFVDAGVRSGDKLRFEYTVDELGDEAYTEYTVDAVLSSTSLRLRSGPTAAVGVAQRGEVWRTYTKDELVDQLVTQAESFSDQRVRLVWPDTATTTDGTVDGYFVCAALAALTGAVASNQNVRNTQFLGFTALPRSASFFNRAQLRRLREGGVWVALEDDGVCYTLWPATTDTTEFRTYEEMKTRNADMVRYALYDAWAPYLGIANITDETIEEIRTQGNELEATVKSEVGSGLIGSPIQSLTMDEVVESDTPGRLIVRATLDGPDPLNAIDLTITG